MKALITGAAGMLGVALAAELRRRDIEFVATGRAAGTAVAAADIRDWNAVREALGDHRPEVVFHLAAETDVDRCEREPEHAVEVEAREPRRVLLPGVQGSLGSLSSQAQHSPECSGYRRENARQLLCVFMG